MSRLTPEQSGTLRAALPVLELLLTEPAAPAPTARPAAPAVPPDPSS
jgi:hypothetical protein